MYSYDQMQNDLTAVVEKFASFTRVVQESDDATDDDYEFYGGILPGEGKQQSWGAYIDLYIQKSADLTLQRSQQMIELEATLMFLDMQSELALPDVAGLQDVFADSIGRPRSTVTEFLEQVQGPASGYQESVETLIEAEKLSYEDLMVCSEDIGGALKEEQAQELFKSLRNAPTENRPALLKQVMMHAIDQSLRYANAELDAMRLEIDRVEKKYAGNMVASIKGIPAKEIVEMVQPVAISVMSVISEAAKLLEQSKPQLILPPSMTNTKSMALVNT